MPRFPLIACRSLLLVLALPSLSGCVTHHCAQHWLMHPEPAGIRNYVIGWSPPREMIETVADDGASPPSIIPCRSDQDDVQDAEIQQAVHHPAGSLKLRQQ
ncbi:MAG: hypothetical protein U0872_09045 [Planctomycetaceae bacterium]